LSARGGASPRDVDLGERLARFADSVGISPQGATERDVQTDHQSDDPVAYLKRIGFYHDNIKAEFKEPRRNPVFEDLGGFPKAITKFLNRKNLTLYRHQREVVEHMRAGDSVVLATPTASGKSLAFNLPTFEKLLKDPAATALYLYPTKALAHDQVDSIRQMIASMELTFDISVYDGDTESSERSAIRESARIIISNPHAMNLYLGWPEGWKRFLANLKVVVVDESHVYGGVLGSHVSLLLRRLRRLIAESGGSEPQFLLASGTIGNPRQHGERLVGRKLHLVDSDGSARMPRTLILWDALMSPDLAVTTQSALLVRHLVRGRRKVIAFSDSRQSAERLARQASDRANIVSAYRAGYPAATRRQIESQLRDGAIKAISSTSALEVGIDIGSIDTVVLNGYPGSIASLLQRAGRAGRMGQESLIVLVLGADPISRYLVKNTVNPFAFHPESAVVEPGNLYVLESQLPLIAKERPINLDRDSAFFGERLRAAVDGGIEKGALVRDENGEISPKFKMPHRYHSFIVSSGPSYKIHFHGRKDVRSHEEQISKEQALREAYLKAIFPHQGVLYRVKKVDHEKREIHAYIETQQAFTVAQTLKTVTPKTLLNKRQESRHLTLTLEEVRVVDQVLGYKEFSGSPPVEKKGRVVGPSSSFDTYAVTARFHPDGAFRSLSPDDLFEGIHALEHATTKAVSLIAIAASQDVTGISFKGDEHPRFSLYEQTPGGSGITEAIFERWRELLEVAYRTVDTCECTRGCPMCILDPSCRDAELSKEHSLVVLKALVAP